MAQRKNAKSAGTVKADAQLEMFANPDRESRPSQQKAYMDSLGANAPNEDCRPADIDIVPSMQVEPPATADARVLGQPDGSDESATPSGTESGGGEAVVNDPKKDEAVVNDCKGELWEMVGIDPAGGEESGSGSGEGIIPPPQEKKMASVTDIKNVLNRMRRKGDQQPMRAAIRLMVHRNMSPDELASLDPDVVTGHIVDFRTVMERRRAEGRLPEECFVPSEMADPERLASRIKHAFYHLGLQFPGQGFPVVSAPEDRSRHPYVFDMSEPLPRLARELEQWRPKLHGDKVEDGVGRAITTEVKKEYKTKVLQTTAFCQLAGQTIGSSFGIEYLTDPETVALWLPLLEAHYSGKGHAPALAGVKRVASDILGAGHPNVVQLAAVQRDASKRHQNKGMDAEDVEKRRDQTRPEAAASHKQIWDLPETIEAYSEQPRLRPVDRNSRKACALAADFVISSPGISPAHLAGFNLDTDVRQGPEGREIRSVDHRGIESWVLIRKATCDRMDRLRDFRAKKGLQSPWLYPTTARTAAQERRVAMTALAACLSVALGTRFTTKDLRDAVLINLVDNGTDDPKTLGDLCGLDSRSVQRRFGLVLDDPLAPANDNEDQNQNKDHDEEDDAGETDGGEEGLGG